MFVALLGIFAARVEVSCELVQVASHPAALDEQGGDRFQCVITALCDNNGVPDVHTAQDAADESGQGEMKEFCCAWESAFAQQ